MPQSKPPITKNIFSIGNKILFTVILTTFTTALLIGTLFYVKISENALENEVQRLSVQTELLSPILKNIFATLEDDVTTLINLPPVQGIIRAQHNNNIDPLDNSTYEQWRERLETIFQSMLESKKDYIQIRYIGVNNNGRELVRVDRKGDKIIRTLTKDLQEKGEEPYVKQALTMPTNIPYFSPVNLNREHGKIQTPHLPVIRTIVPIKDEKTNQFFGLIVINAAYKSILSTVLENLKINRDLYLINENGDYLHYQQSNATWEFHLAKSSDNKKKSLVIAETILASNSEAGTFINVINNQENIVHYTKVHFAPSNPQRFISIALSVPKKTLLAPSKQIRENAIQLGIVLILASSLTAGLLSSMMTRPLSQIIKSVRAYGAGKKDFTLPINQNNEIGELANAFQDMTINLEHSINVERSLLTRIQNILDNTLDGLLTINDKGIIEEYNKACEKLFGYKQEEAIGQNIKILMPEPYHSEHDQYLKNYHNTGKKKIIGIGREVLGKRKNGEIFPLDLSVSEVEIMGSKLYSGIVRDITERKKAENEIMRSNAELERFAYLASHDLQEPLRMVSNFTSLLQEEYADQLDEHAQEYMGFVVSSAKRMQTLVSDLLEYSRVGSEETGFIEFNVETQLNIVLENLKISIEETQAHITFDTMPTIYANPVRFCSILQNLIGNALKYRDKEKTPRIHIGTKDHNDKWLFFIRDNGIGIPSKHYDQIFVVFKRLHNKDEYSGTGIGLSICKKIVESLGGEIWVESKAGKGSTFSFTIPKPQTLKNQ